MHSAMSRLIKEMRQEFRSLISRLNAPIQEYMTEDMETEQILVSFGPEQVEGSFLQDCLCQSLKTDKN